MFCLSQFGRQLLFACYCLSVFGAVQSPVQAQVVPLELRDGDRIVLVGGTFIEREGQFGELETMLTTACADRQLVFRNLGWSGDTVWGDSRGIFDAPAVGYNRLQALITELKPTVVVLQYGLNESYAGPAGIPAFIEQYNKLCTDACATGARLVLVTPLPLETPAAPLPDAARHNPVLAEYCQAIRQLASERGASLVDLFSRPTGAAVLTENGVHLAPAGYRQLADELQIAWGLPEASLSVPARETLRRKIVEKNQLFFHRWRPQNTTYLLGFRKHEQGNNAVELPKFDELVLVAEQEIQQLKRPTSN